MGQQLRHCVGGKLLDKHGTVDEPRVTFPRGTASVLEGRERSQPYRTSTRSRVDLYTINMTLAHLLIGVFDKHKRLSMRLN